MKDRLLGWLNQLLVINLFFVLACFVWFAAAIVGRSAHFSLGLDLWYQLWQPVMQPAIGILMAGALVSGASSWLQKKFSRETEI
ncbi:MAG: hypothetical protein RLZZ511_3760 [Cyanobacteriota bacterium]|jgi:TRAP-type C4-dicarboxylate transport system permease small subunit